MFVNNHESSISPRQFGSLLGVILFSVLIALLGRSVISAVTSLHPLAADGSPYLRLDHALLLYGTAPIVALSGFIFFLAPGLVWVIALWRPNGAGEWSVMALAFSIVAVAVISTILKATLGVPITLGPLAAVWIALTIGGALFVWSRLQSSQVGWPLDRSETRRVVQVAVASWIGVAVLVPKIFWEDFNSDGVESFEFGRSLARHYLPHWEIQPGVFGFYHNYVLFAFPNHWFITLFGPYEAAVRLPFVLYIVLIFTMVLRLVELDSPRRLRWPEELAMWCGVVVFALVLGLNSPSEPHYADLAEHGAVDSLWLLSFMATMSAVWTRRWGWVIAFALMTNLSSPGGLLCLLILTALSYLFSSSEQRGGLVPLGIALGLIILISIAHHFYMSGFLEVGRSQFGAQGLLSRLYPPQLMHFDRFNALIFASGLIPSVALFAIRPRERLSWIVGGVALSYFGLLYVQSWALLHQFAPALILPLVVFWRLYLHHNTKIQRALLPIVVAGAAASFYFSLPVHWKVLQLSRSFGAITEYGIGDYEDDYEAAATGSHSLSLLLPKDYRLSYPNQPWGTDPHVWVYYATRAKSPGTRINYVVRPASVGAPPNASEVGQKNGVVVYVYDEARWLRDRKLDFPRTVPSPLYESFLANTFAFYRAYVDSQNKQKGIKEQKGR